MPESFKELDVVALTADVPRHGVFKGQVGAIVDRLGDDVYQVEFVDPAGTTYALETLRAEQLLLLKYEPVAA